MHGTHQYPKLTIYVGTSCRPYPSWRHPGWNRFSAGLHLDDFRKFFEDSAGGQEYSTVLEKQLQGRAGKEAYFIGCGYQFATGVLFYTFNGETISSDSYYTESDPVARATAFTGIHLPSDRQDVYAAIGVEKECKFEVNFGGELFKWAEGNEWQWKVDGMGQTPGEPGGFSGFVEPPPSYSGY